MEKHGKKIGGFPRIAALLAAALLLCGLLSAFAAPVSEKISAFLPPAAQAEENWKPLKKGSSGAEVRKAQQALQELGYYQGRIDGNFSRTFEEAVIAFQRDWGLEASGALDWDTYSLLTEDIKDAPPSDPAAASPDATAPPEEAPFVVFGQDYDDKEHVAAYLRLFGELPPNYITKAQARALGWVSSQGNLWQVAPGKSIGGDRFGNYEGLLPEAKGRTYYECDIDYPLDQTKHRGGRNGKRIIFSSDGLIFYTEDHYATFEDVTLEETVP